MPILSRISPNLGDFKQKKGPIQGFSVQNLGNFKQKMPNFSVKIPYPSEIPSKNPYLPSPPAI